jgi:hypothetical protein
MGFYVRDYYCGNGNVVLPTTYLSPTYLSPTCPEPTDPTDTPSVLQAVKLSTLGQQNVARGGAGAVGSAAIAGSERD